MEQFYAFACASSVDYADNRETRKSTELYVLKPFAGALD